MPIVFNYSFAGVMKSIQAFVKWSDKPEKVSGVIIILVSFCFLGLG
ncbi:MAG: hypothetical protein MUO42_10410 [Anaerolineaceae bacterium]|nr:hypothetical protein [Anaerolineaceae bacterium]